MSALSGQTPRLSALAFPNDDARWEAVKRRDRAADGAFFYSVASTGIYCRPSCASRLALRRNIAFHPSARQAEEAGFRACKRCRPNQSSPVQRHADAVAQVCRVIDEAEEIPSLASLAALAGLSPFHFHRVFKSITGITPKAYAAQRRDQRMRNQLTNAPSVTEAIYRAGFTSSSRFYEKSAAKLGMNAGAFRAGGAGESIRFAVGETSLGPILVAATKRGVSAIRFGESPDLLVRELEDEFPKADLIGGDRNFERLVAVVVAQVERPRADFTLPLDVEGTAFQHRVWKALSDIPMGDVASYSDIAKRIGAPKSVRAVAQACAANRTALAIPCHRIVRNDGAIGLSLGRRAQAGVADAGGVQMSDPGVADRTG